MTKLRSVGAQIRVAMQANLEATRKALQDTAKREHAKVLSSDPKPGGFRRIVDGVEGAREEQARAFGVIRYEYERLEPVVQFAMERLFDLSPVDEGLYRNSHTLFVDGAAATDLKDWRPGHTIVVSNYVPYSRKIELGVMSMRVSGTAQVYGQAERIVRRRFGNIARVNFTYRGVSGPALAKGKEGGESSIRYPALEIGERNG